MWQHIEKEIVVGDDDRAESVLRDLKAEGLIECSGAHWKGRRYLRFSVSSWRRDADDIEDAIERGVDRMR